MPRNAKKPAHPPFSLEEAVELIASASDNPAAYSDILNVSAAPLAIAGGATAALDMLIALSPGQKRRDDRRAEAAVAMLIAMLVMLSSEETSGNPKAGPLIAKFRGHLDRHGERLHDGIIPGIVHALEAAGIEPGPAFAEHLSGQYFSDPKAVSLAALEEQLSYLAKQLQNDPVLVHEALRDRLPEAPEQVTAFAGLMARHANPIIREASLGFLAELPMKAVAELLGIIAGDAKPSDAHLARLRLLRDGLPAGLQGRADSAITTLERRVAEPQGKPTSIIIGCICSMPDGAGAQSIAALLRIGRKHGFVALLLKQGKGLKDAVVETGLTKAQATARFDAMAEAMPACDASQELLRLRLPMALAENTAAARPPGLAVLEALRLLGIRQMAPDSRPLSELVATLLAALPEAKRDEAAMLAARATLPGHAQGMLESWFEGDEVALRELARAKAAARERLLLTRLLPARRVDWAWRCAWAAAPLILDGGPDTIDDGAQLALIARDLLGDLPIEELALMRHIARESLAAFRASRR